MLSKCRTFFYVIFVDGKLCEDDKTPGYGHAENFIFADGKWYMLDTTGNHKQPYACDIDQYRLLTGATGKDISSTVASRMVEYFNRFKDHVTEEVYEIRDFHDKKFDGN